MIIFPIANIILWMIVIGLIIYARFLKNPLSRSKITTGDMVRSISFMILSCWCILVGLVVSIRSMFETFMGLFK